LHFASLLHLHFLFLLLPSYYILLYHIPSFPSLVWLTFFPFSSLTFYLPFMQFLYVTFLLSLPVYLSFFAYWSSLLCPNFCTMLRYPTWSFIRLRHLLVIKILPSSIYDTCFEDRTHSLFYWIRCYQKCLT
jgi:hypothetical protein